ncbi:putative integral membrane protein [Babesia bovis T2Bo]|uniref:Membrane protein, putative n=1 Tax=Babesia bovis TaxID=5865 RepID=A7AP40_BABBO|nr:putative integral membrane protein [Babesia bovis T2Bo]EDO08324.1 putative integral membrane protein [Babesia bovis T2Bo]|eukprot:XP_001611892.1 membrane protein [Babesia bovis T2Bo]
MNDISSMETPATPSEKFGTMAWLDNHMKLVFSSIIGVGYAFLGLLCAYVVYLAKLRSTQNLLNLTVMVGIFITLVALSNIVGILAVALMSESCLTIFTVNNSFIILLDVFLSGIHFGMATHNGREAIVTDSTANVFFLTGFCFTSKALLYIMMLYLGFRLKKTLRHSVLIGDIKINDGNTTISGDLNKTQMGIPIIITNQK